ncbi:hypothetical protein [Clostridium guangxiense]|uniref:hypothetical protein n=1 Tax=Clostridium guangxiense TaxID=1662055 RepID=UPI001E4F0C4C|nr:hypothetical protein [Clostridium guangxiense]MCD2345173.1 hypothetical protein [Clostridium guangxiense]
MKIKIALIPILISAFLCIFVVNNEIKFKSNNIKTPRKTVMKKYKKIKFSEILDTLEKYKGLKIDEVKYDNMDAYANVSINGNIKDINNMVSNFRQEKNLIGIKEINVTKTSENERAKMKLVFRHYEEVN